MFTLSLRRIRQFKTCPQGPEIDKWFAERYDEDDEIDLNILFDKFGDTHTVFCLRAVPGGPEFALKYTRACVRRVREVFESEFDKIEDIEFIDCLTSSDWDFDSSKKCGKNMESFLKNTDSKNTKAIRAGCAAAKLAFAAYSISQPHVSVDYCLGAIEDAKEAANNGTMENEWQKAKLKELLLGQRDEQSSNVCVEDKQRF